jgi:hypothetical protein
MYETTNDEMKSVYHVIARTQGNPPIYYYRQWINSSRWTAWTKIEIDIKSDHILPVVWNRRLYLFWAIIHHKPDKNQGKQKSGDQAMSNAATDTASHLEVQLAWSEYKGHKWLAKQTSPQTIVIKGDLEPDQVTLKSTITDQLLRLDVFTDQIVTYKDQPTGMTYQAPGRAQHSEFALGGIGNAVEAFILDACGLEGVGPETQSIGTLLDWQIYPLLPPWNSTYKAMTITACGWDQLSSERQRYSQCYTMFKDASGQLKPALILSKADYYRLIVPHQFIDFDSCIPFFYEDTNRTYFLIPSNRANYQDKWTQYQFVPFYHAFVPLFIRELNRGGLDALFSRDLQLTPAAIQNKVQGTPAFDSIAFRDYYLPGISYVPDFPNEGVDFESNAGYAIYNWELFFHAPFMIGESLSRNNQFEDAKHWYEYIFNPTSGTVDAVPQRFWVTKPFYTMKDYQAESIRNLMNLIHINDERTVKQVNEWRDDPFDPHLIAQLRPVAYQRTIVMKYIDNLIAWGDQLFRQDTMESVNEATQMYVLAAELLGPRPEIIKPLGVPPDMTYNELEKAGLDEFANASVVAAENLLGPVPGSGGINSNSSASGSVQGGGSVDPGTPKLSSFNTLYFSIPPNNQLLGYWDVVADRLFKIRHCMNIEGVRRQLALFAPPIDPGLIVRAAAAGLDLGSILNDASAALLPYRFRVIVREAMELCEMVRGFGNELLGALEKKDAEILALKRAGYEKKIQEQIRTVLQRRLDEASQEIDILVKQRKNILDRQIYYNQRKDELTNDWEAAALLLHGGSVISDAAALSLDIGASIFNLLPSFQFGTAGWASSPYTTINWGSSNIGSAASAASSASRMVSAILQTLAGMSQTIGSYQRRKEDWGLQYTLATDDIITNDSQSLVAAIRQDIAQKELDNHDTHLQLASDVADFLHNKYTNQDLYEWMISQTSATYFQAYQLAYTLAKRAEQCFRRELSLSDSSFIQFGYWDSLKKGLLSGDKLLFDLQRLNSAYYEQNARELELTKHISLLAFDPHALVELRSSPDHTCTINLPEILFDLENPGHYMRRIKSVGITVPCVVGPYTGVSMTLTLNENHVRTSPISDDYQFFPLNPGRFVNDQGGVSAIVTSHAQNDRGMFELKYDDERYLPFECGGAISSWSLRLNPVYPQFDYSTISDVILHLQYTARDGGEVLRNNVKQAVQTGLNEIALAKSRTGIYCLINARHEFASNWQKFLHPASGDQVLTLDISPDRFPFITNGLYIKITGIDFVAKLSNAGDYTLLVTPPLDNTTPKPERTMKKNADLNGLHEFYLSNNSNPPLVKIPIGSTSIPNPSLTWSIQLKSSDATNYRSLSASEIEDLLLVVKYEVSSTQ